MLVLLPTLIYPAVDKPIRVPTGARHLLFSWRYFDRHGDFNSVKPLDQAVKLVGLYDNQPAEHLFESGKGSIVKQLDSRLNVSE
jgi:hypothetical protein